ncbi:MAG: L-seryl-tRNA(Sec) selenium transferase [Firmicutes bacterium]|nr:L-seryl-tRNA(Sec) selenium transferase [Bacillota bacterium]
MNYALLPKIDRVTDEAERRLSASGVVYARQVLTDAVRDSVNALRESGWDDGLSREGLFECAVLTSLGLYTRRVRPSFRPVLNATGIVLHTNLGRAPLAREAVRALAEDATGYCNLELDLDSGARGERNSHVSALLCGLCGSEDAIAVNNAAAALLLALDTLAKGGEAVVSRGQAVEVGGGFRIPDVVARGGAVLQEVGATNKCRIADYEAAINEKTACVLQVHPSNFSMSGFVEAVSTAELAQLAHARNLPLIYDLGSGPLYPFAEAGIGQEPLPARAISDGADLLIFSGDKLLGGPQAGIIAGKRELLNKIRKNPLIRALRADKLCLCALEATLALYRDGREREIPVVSMLLAPESELRRRAEALFAALDRCAAECSLARIKAPVGGGSLPGVELLSWVVEILPKHLRVDDFLYKLRTGDTPVLAYIHEGKACFDLRCVPDEKLNILAEAIRNALL